MRKPIIVGNWKMNKTIAATKAFVEAVDPEVTDKADWGIATPYLALQTAKAGAKNLIVAAENVHFKDSGAYTGEVSVEMLKEIGVEWVILGHSERRQYFGETDETVNAKMLQVLKNDMTPIVCVGETLEEALYKGFTAAGKKMSNDRGVVLATVNDQDKEEFLEIAKDMKRVGYTFMATEGTASLLRSNGIDSIVVNKIGEVRPNILDVITNNQVDMVINTPTKGNDATRDGFRIRRLATEYSIDVMTSLDTLKALVKVNQKHINKDQLKVYNLAE